MPHIEQRIQKREEQKRILQTFWQNLFSYFYGWPFILEIGEIRSLMLYKLTIWGISSLDWLENV